MATKAGRIQPKDVRQGKMFWIVQGKYNAVKKSVYDQSDPIPITITEHQVGDLYFKYRWQDDVRGYSHLFNTKAYQRSYQNQQVWYRDVFVSRRAAERFIRLNKKETERVNQADLDLVINPALKNVIPQDPDLTPEVIAQIVDECMVNYRYLVKKVARLTDTFSPLTI